MKICAPIVKTKYKDIVDTAHAIDESNGDMMEVRLDHYQDVLDIDMTVQLMKDIKNTIKKPLICTFRTKGQGGAKNISREYYQNLYSCIISDKLSDLVDVEYTMEEEIVRDLQKKAKEKNIKIIFSYHDFEKTPKIQTMKDILDDMAVKGADIVKIAVMPQTLEDVENLKNVAIYSSAKRPTVAISMGILGQETRINAKDMGVYFTFASLDGQSAPGQVPISMIKK